MAPLRPTAVMIVMILIGVPLRAADVYRSDLVGELQTKSIPVLLNNEVPDALASEITASADRMWLISTRHLSADACAADLLTPDLRVGRLDPCGNHQGDSLESFLKQRTPLVIHIHGNRMTHCQARDRGRFVHRQIRSHLGEQPMDFAIFSWPSERTGLPLRDGRVKAARTEAQGLYLAWLLREVVSRDIPTTLVGYSFGGRIATGALHVLAGGHVGGRELPESSIRGANINVALVAPAVEEDSLESGRHHGLAPQNIREMALFYNPRDAILKRYWLIDVATRGRALGFSGPRSLAPGFDGSPVPLIAHNCAPFLGIRHSEVEYYTQHCRAGRTIARLIQNDSYWEQFAQPDVLADASSVQ
jgi:hypothetical protein